MGLNDFTDPSIEMGGSMTGVLTALGDLIDTMIDHADQAVLTAYLEMQQPHIERAKARLIALREGLDS